MPLGKKTDNSDKSNNHIDTKIENALGNRNRNKGKLKAFSTRLYESDIEALTEHFENKGLKLTQGIRMIITTYIQEEGL